jgi:hypothetical protein
MTALPGSEDRGRLWPMLVAVGIFATYFAWAGHSYDPRMAFWLTKTEQRWTVLAPGLAHLALAGVFLFAALSVLAHRLRVAMVSGNWYWTAAGMTGLLIGAAWVRWEIWSQWLPFQLSAEVVGTRRFLAIDGGWRGWAVAADMVTTALLMGILWMRRAPGGYWGAALFVFHPLALWMGAGNGAWMNCALPAVVLVAAMSPRLKRPVIDLLVAVMAVVLLVALVYQPGFRGGTAFNGLAAQVMEVLGVLPSARQVFLLLGYGVCACAVVLLGRRARWDLARTWGHLLVMWALWSPTVMPSQVMGVVALAVLAWNGAGWVLSFTVMLSYAAVFTWERGTPWELPAWMVWVMFVPVAVVQGAELMGAAREVMISRLVDKGAPRTA